LSYRVDFCLSLD